MAERYDAAIIGAGADGLAAAAMLAGTGLRVIVIERHARPGGRLVTREFHPGFRASPFADEIAPIPSELFWSLDLARHGALLMPAPPALALWPDRAAGLPPAVQSLLRESVKRNAAALAASLAVPPPPPSRWNPFGAPPSPAWPAESFQHRSLLDVAGDSPATADATAVFVAHAVDGRAVDPFATGSALHLVAPPTGSGVPRGGLGTLGEALADSALAAGAEISCGLDVTDIRHRDNRATALALADGTEIAARAVISTLDLKRTFLSLFSWKDLPAAVVKRAGDFRMAGSTARLLLALDRPPVPAAGGPLPQGAIACAPDIAMLAGAQAAWRSGVVAERLPLVARIGSATDPGLAPKGAATITVTAGCVPHTLFDGTWTHEKRDGLASRILASLEALFPSISACVVGRELLVPPDFEEALGITAGDLQGGEIAPDQMFAYRPWLDGASPRTPVDGLFLAGPSSAAGPLATCASGAIAARTLLADFSAGRLP